MIFAIFRFLGTPFGKVVGIAVGVMALLGALWGAIAIHDSNIRKAALEEYNKKQLELVIEQQKDFERKTRILQETQARMIDDLNQTLEGLDRRVVDVDGYLKSNAAKKADRPASDVLKETLKRLGAP